MEKQMHYFSWTRCTFLYIEQSLIYGIILLTTTAYTHLYFRWNIAEYNLINGMCSCLHECCIWFFLWQNACIYCQHSSVVNDVLNESCTYRTHFREKCSCHCYVVFSICTIFVIRFCILICTLHTMLCQECILHWMKEIFVSLSHLCQSDVITTLSVL